MAILLTSAAYHPGLLTYLAVPGVVAGVRHGWVTTVNATALGAVAVIVTLVLAPNADVSERLSTVAALAARRARRRTARQLAVTIDSSIWRLDRRPYAAAHQLMARIHRLASSGSLGSGQCLARHRARRRACARQPAAPARPSSSSIRARRSDPLNGGEDVDALGPGDRDPGRRPHPRRGRHSPAWRPAAAGLLRAGRGSPVDAELDERALARGRRVRRPTRHRRPLRRGPRAGDRRGAQPDRPRDARRRRPGDRRPGLHRRRDRVDQRPGPDPRAGADTARRDHPSRLRDPLLDLRPAPPRRRRTDCRVPSPTTSARSATTPTCGSTCSSTSPGPPLPHGPRPKLLRVAQEAIGNVRKHATRTQPVGHPRLRRLEPAPRGRGRRSRQRRAHATSTGGFRPCASAPRASALDSTCHLRDPTAAPSSACGRPPTSPQRRDCP